MDKNEPAYPCGEHTGYEPYSGMTLRDYFAAKAMQGALAAGDESSTTGLAAWAYNMADAMLDARSKEESEADNA